MSFSMATISSDEYVRAFTLGKVYTLWVKITGLQTMVDWTGGVN